ncbi:mercury methylation ferredoxin HgcB [Desulfovibrio inopinatus]|uniref:mercury methylation ferredoxin HgcB n=1 Tax=Desulfovibrio inopinatus TaxID=102109 RepID=UPI0004098A76|nr:mercury methylation ferredoxin HgcB [Desulfovibrio inopinatus]
MNDFRYLDNVSTLVLDPAACVGCGMCEIVCPHGVLRVEDRMAVIVDHDACMECGACALNCPTHALTVTPGVGCASYLIQTWFKKDNSKGTACC